MASYHAKARSYLPTYFCGVAIAFSSRCCGRKYAARTSTVLLTGMAEHLRGELGGDGRRHKLRRRGARRRLLRPPACNGRRRSRRWTTQPSRRCVLPFRQRHRAQDILLSVAGRAWRNNRDWKKTMATTFACCARTPLAGARCAAIVCAGVASAANSCRPSGSSGMVKTSFCWDTANCFQHSIYGRVRLETDLAGDCCAATMLLSGEGVSPSLFNLISN